MWQRLCVAPCSTPVTSLMVFLVHEQVVFGEKRKHRFRAFSSLHTAWVGGDQDVGRWEL